MCAHTLGRTPEALVSRSDRRWLGGKYVNDGGNAEKFKSEQKVVGWGGQIEEKKEKRRVRLRETGKTAP